MEGEISTDLSATPALAAPDVVVAFLLMAGLGLLAAVIRLTRLRLREHREEHRELPPLVYPARLVSTSPEVADAAGDPAAAAGEQVTFDSTAPAVRIVRDGPQRAGAGAVLHGGPIGNGNGDAAGAPDMDATLQLLPGRLEPADGSAHHEIRFVRVPGINRFTLGRSPGPAHSHIQLKAVTASRVHAYMEFDGGRWQLGNMSRTNHAVVNGSPLNGDAPRPLEDGDRIEFGELTFVFRER
ncbi:MAG TPA: FHA domain-containing protein [Longimicrobiales bacterium]|nr:FHA domain-containing protein [Longimicrobiales bacterium]